MQHIGKSKIGSLSARKGVKHPQLRLPQQCADVIGDTAEIFETESDGKRAFLIVTDQTMPKDDYVLKHLHSVLKQCHLLARGLIGNDQKSTFSITFSFKNVSCVTDHIGNRHTVEVSAVADSLRPF